MRYPKATQTLSLIFFILSLSFVSASIAADTDWSRIKNAIMDSASLSNGEMIYVKGIVDGDSNIPFTAGPDWLHLDAGGCLVCHGPKGLGKIEPAGCFISTPPIAFGFLKNKGYDIQLALNGSKLSIKLQLLKRAIQSGVTPDNEELDYCMPRWRINDKNLLDLTTYLISLDSEHNSVLE